MPSWYRMHRSDMTFCGWCNYSPAKAWGKKTNARRPFWSILFKEIRSPPLTIRCWSRLDHVSPDLADLVGLFHQLWSPQKCQQRDRWAKSVGRGMHWSVGSESRSGMPSLAKPMTGNELGQARRLTKEQWWLTWEKNLTSEKKSQVVLPIMNPSYKWSLRSDQIFLETLHAHRHIATCTSRATIRSLAVGRLQGCTELGSYAA